MLRRKHKQRRLLEELVAAADETDVDQVLKLLDRRNELPKPAVVVESLVLSNPALARELWERGAAFRAPAWWAGSWPPIVDRLLLSGQLEPARVIDAARIKLPKDAFAALVHCVANMLVRAGRSDEAVELAAELTNPFLAKAVEVLVTRSNELLSEARRLFALDGAVYPRVLLGVEAACDPENEAKMLGSAVFRWGAGPFTVPQLLPIPDPGTGSKQLMLVRSELEAERGPHLCWQFVVASSEDEAGAYVHTLAELDETKVVGVICQSLYEVEVEQSGLALMWNDHGRGTQIGRHVAGYGDRWLQVQDLTGMAELHMLNALLDREPSSPVQEALNRNREKWPVPLDCPLVPELYRRAIDTGLFD